MKRGGDLSVAALAAIVALPLALLIAALLRCTTGGPILERQTRTGRHGREFQLLRFRTGPDGRLGALLRRTGLDELPRLWNVVRGEMGVIGPRPDHPDRVLRYSCRERARLTVRPGLTGWAQLHAHPHPHSDGRPHSRGRPRPRGSAELDLWYVEHRSLRLDLRILGLTVLALLRPEALRLRPAGEQPS
ncbi:sugar transferase [Streptomyces sp. 1331.2]|uniref:sugar transferase n=1 Tax=Streptomyces sp. 1331.2 TaxID=1938835 RepID=UPI000BCF988C|nr:sugar transferase [Streptomyces sp. 1331.2]SOB80213.1 Sugar transferase involved in LPS biosynthesis (colanic, teichoic acid) [Streptomyces sp. 1331.2]